MNIGTIHTSSYAATPAAAIGPLTPSAPTAATQHGASASIPASTSTQLSNEALALIDQLKARDLEVRQHEQAHMAAAGGLATYGASYTYQRGPNGVDYAIGGEVNIDTSPGATPEETIQRAHAIQAAALAPAEPSGPDRAVASQAQQMEMQARAELAKRSYASGPAASPSVDLLA